MISSGERSRPPSIGLKMSAVICGKSAVLLPAAFASSTGSFFVQLAKATDAHARSELPTRARRRTLSLPFPNAFTAPLLICWSRVFWQEDSERNLLTQNGRKFFRCPKKDRATAGQLRGDREQPREKVLPE